MISFLLGVLSSLIASFVVLLLTNREDFRFFILARGRYKQLGGDWNQYHLTFDTQAGPNPIWVLHSESLKITAFGRVTGTSQGTHTTRLAYRIRGTIRRGVMRLRLENVTSEESVVVSAYPNLLSDQIVRGMWIGQDFNQHWTTGPIVLSRTLLNNDQLREIVNGYWQILKP